ncbi:MAG: PH domain-containing protein [Deltaproteobacteria bacterium]|jgi:hypothetical protein|nr:PH domain-containing protein [Deltaproteobacteria bacterium]
MGEIEFDQELALQELTETHGFFGRLGVFGIGRALAYLPKILTEGEKVQALTRGHIGARLWLLAITDARAILISRGYLLGLKLLDIPLSQIKMIFHSLGLMFGEIVLHCGDCQTRLALTPKRDMPEFMTALASAMAKRAKPKTSPQAERLALLERLGSLLAQGALTPAEFLAQKKKILTGGQ